MSPRKRGCAWAKDLAPSNELRKWIYSDMTRWAEFKRRYARELDAHPEKEYLERF